MKKMMLVGALAVAAAVGCSESSRDMQKEAWRACHDFIEKRITVSDFEDQQNARISVGTGGEYTVGGQAATALGPVRYTCRIRYEAAADQWRLLNLTGV